MKFIWEYYTGKSTSVYLCIRFQLGKSFGNTKMERKIYLCILLYSFSTRHLFWNSKMDRTVYLYKYMYTYVFVFN